METFLLALAGTVVGVLLLVWLAIWWVKRWLRKTFEPLSGALQAMMPERLTISLERTAAADARDVRGFAELCEALQALGFDLAGHFTCEELANCVITGFVKPSDSTYAAVCELATTEPWCDFVTQYEDGRSCTYCNLPENGSDQPPWVTSVKMPGKPLAEIYDAFLKGRPRGAMKPVSVEAFRSAFETAYERTMRWRLVRGVSEEEVRRVAATGNMEVTEDTIAMAIATRRAMRDAQIASLLTKRYLETSGVSAADSERWQDRVVTIHDTCDSQVPIDALLRAMGVYDEDGSESEDDREMSRALEQRRREFQAACKDRPVRAAFSALIREHLPEGSARIIFTMDEPVAADLWLMPETAAAN